MFKPTESENTYDEDDEERVYLNDEDDFQDDEENQNQEQENNVQAAAQRERNRQCFLVCNMACILVGAVLSLTAIGLGVGLPLSGRLDDDDNNNILNTTVPTAAPTATQSAAPTTAPTVPQGVYLPAADPEQRVPNEYTIQYAFGADEEANAQALALIQEELIQWRGAQILETYTDALKGVSIECGPPSCDPETLQGFLETNKEYFATIEEDTYINATQSVSSNGAIGLDRIDQISLPLDSTYNVGSQFDGTGVDIYVLDTGLTVVNEEEFDGRIGEAFDSTSDSGGPVGFDGQGHGTHVAGTCASLSYGVAKGATIIPVKVLDSSGSGSTSTVISGINHVISEHNSAIATNPSTKSVINMSLGGSRSTSLNNAVENAVNQGIVVVVAAGNEDLDACNFSPASATSAITVGSTTSTDERSSFSNFGSCLDIFAPGSGILSTYINEEGTAFLSGTSMASPHVAGAVALYMQANPDVTPADVPDAIVALGLTGIITDAGNGSPNVLLNIANIPTSITTTAAATSTTTVTTTTTPATTTTTPATTTTTPATTTTTPATTTTTSTTPATTTTTTTAATTTTTAATTTTTAATTTTTTAATTTTTTAATTTTTAAMTTTTAATTTTTPATTTTTPATTTTTPATTTTTTVTTSATTTDGACQEDAPFSEECSCEEQCSGAAGAPLTNEILRAVILAYDAGDLQGYEAYGSFPNCWDVSQVTDMSDAFTQTAFNQPIHCWDTSNVNDMTGMFRQSFFSQYIGNWDVSKVTSMASMFESNIVFDSPIDEWDVGKVENMESMFSGAAVFNQPIGGWNVGKVANMNSMFEFAILFDQPLSDWDTSKVTSMRSVFSRARVFDQDISEWDVSKVTTFELMFESTPFNQDISGWDLSSAKDLSGMFKGATSFNQPIGGWDVPSVELMVEMFSSAINFNQDLSGWDIANVQFMGGMFRIAVNFNQDLCVWNDRATPQVLQGVDDMFLLSNCDEGADPNLALLGQPGNTWCFDCGGQVTDSTTTESTVSTTNELTESSTTWSTSSMFTTTLDDKGCKPDDIFDKGCTCEEQCGPSRGVPLTDASFISAVGAYRGGFLQGYEQYGKQINCWDVSQVTDMTGAFADSDFNEPIHCWDVGSVTDFSAMFSGATQFDRHIGRWDVSSATNMNSMFNSASAFNSPLREWDVTKVTDMTGMFAFSGFNQEIEDWAVFSVTQMVSMFEFAEDFDQNLCKWNNKAESLTATESMFADTSCESMNSPDLSKLGSPGNSWCAICDGGGIGTTPPPPIGSTLPTGGTITPPPPDSTCLPDSSFRPQCSCADQCEGFTSGTPLTDNTFYDAVDAYLNFEPQRYKDYGEYINCWDVSQVTDMSEAFLEAPFVGAPLHCWDTSNVRDMSRMFQASAFFGYIGNWDVSSVITFEDMFRNSSYSQDISGWDVSSAENFEGMFSDTLFFNSPIGQWDVSSAKSLSFMFVDAFSFNQDLSSWDVSGVETMIETFAGAVGFNQPLCDWASKVTQGVLSDVTDIFFDSGCPYQSDPDVNDLGSSSNIWCIPCGGDPTDGGGTDPPLPLPTQPGGNCWPLSGFGQGCSCQDQCNGHTTGNPLTDDTFHDAIAAYLDFDTERYETFGIYMNCWDVSQVTNMSEAFLEVESFSGEPLHCWDTSNVVDMSGMFRASIFGEYIGNWDVSKVTNMASMFQDNLAFDSPLGDWDVRSVTNMAHMFAGAIYFDKPIGDWKVGKVTNMDKMFTQTSFFNQDLSKWDTSKVTSMNSVFAQAFAFDQDISGWDVSNVEDMSSMFRDTFAFNQKLTDWKVSKVKFMSQMFQSASQFNQRLCKWNDVATPEVLQDVEDMFLFSRCDDSTTPDLTQLGQPGNTWCAQCGGPTS